MIRAGGISDGRDARSIVSGIVSGRTGFGVYRFRRAAEPAYIEGEGGEASGVDVVGSHLGRAIG